MSHVPAFRGVVLLAAAAVLAACCTRPLGAHRPPPAFGAGEPPPHARGHGERPLPPPPGIEDAISACAAELDLLPPPAVAGGGRPEMTEEQHALLGACLEGAGYPPPPMGPPGDPEEPV